MPFLLIDVTKTEETKILVVANIREVQLWGQYYKLKGRKVIAPQLSGRAFSALERGPLQYLFWNTFQQPPSEVYKDLLANCAKMAGDLPIEETSEQELICMVANLQPVNEVGEVIKIQRKTNVPKEPRDPNARPKTGSLTGQVWQLCDELMSQLGRIPERKEAIAYCQDPGGIHKATASTQYAKWKKALASKNLKEKA